MLRTAIAWCQKAGAWSLKAGAWSLKPGTWGLKPGTCGLRPEAWGLRPAARGLRSVAWSLAALIVCALPAPLEASRLVDAVKARDEAAVRALLAARADVNATTGDGTTALHWAVYHEDPELVDLLLKAGARANVANDLSITPLYLAAAAGNASIVHALLSKGARADAASESGVTPLMQAARSGNVEAVRALLAARADVKARERERGQTALMWAASRGHSAVVDLLVAHGADVHARTRVRPLTVMLDQGPRRVVKTSMQDARQIEAGGSTALLFAAQSGDAASVRRLLAAGANRNDTAADGRSALVLAAFDGHPEVAAALVDAGADVDAAAAGYTALHAAALRGDRATVAALLARGANPNAPLTQGSPVRRFGSQWALPSTMKGGTPLLVAAAYLEVDIMRALLAAGARHDAASADGTTPLLAAAGVPVEMLARPSDLQRWNIVDSDTPQVPRHETEVLDGVTLLLDAGADVNQANADGDTALHGAATSGQTRVIQLLADRGARLDVPNKAGQTPLMLTQPRGRDPGHPAAAELIQKLLSRQ
jgi:ankyrin repeat protein